MEWKLAPILVFAAVIAVLVAGAALVGFSISRGFGQAAAAEGTRQTGGP